MTVLEHTISGLSPGAGAAFRFRRVNGLKRRDNLSLLM